MKLAITDTCIFIDLHELNLTEHFFQLDIEVHTSLDVYNELYSEQQEVLDQLEHSGKFTKHSISDQEQAIIQCLDLSNGLSVTDKTVIYLAAQLKAMILSSDNLIRKTATKQCIERHGLIWIFDQLVEQNIIQKSDAHQKLLELKSLNLMYHNNPKLNLEIDRRIEEWSK